MRIDATQTQWLACLVTWKRDRNRKTAAALKQAEETYCATFYAVNSQQPYRPRFKRFSKWMDPYAMGSQ